MIRDFFIFFKKKSSFTFNSNGQLLAEILIVIGIASILLAASTVAILGALQQNFESRGNQISSSLAIDLQNQVASFSDSNWHNLYSLLKEQTNKYYLISNSSTKIAILGEESILSNDITFGLIGHWKFDETTGIIAYDSSGNFNNGVLINNPTRIASSSCQVGKCLSFDGINDYVSIGDSSIFNITSQITFGGWVKRTSATDYQVFVGKYYYGTSNTGSWVIHESGNNDAFYCSVNIGGVWKSVQSVNNLFDINSWHNVYCVYDGSFLSIYVDGVKSGLSVSATGLIATSTYPVTIGAANNGFSQQNFLTGYVDDVRIYNRALSANEIKQLYQSSVYSRFFYVENVSRDLNGAIESIYDANKDDPSTQKVVVVVTGEKGRKNEINSYLTRSRRNSIFWQSDWSGGEGQEGPISEANNRYSSANNITARSFLQITNKSSDGVLYSSTFDTQIDGGAAFNSIMWRGNKPTGTNVKFQIASSNSISGQGGSATGTIDTIYRYAWNDYIGWIDFGYSSGNVFVNDNQLTGYAYNDDVGEISLDCATSPGGNICASSNYKVTRDSNGNLAGWAWNDSIGWISFCGGLGTTDCPGSIYYRVNVNPNTGYFSGWAWNDIIGWISFNCADAGFCGFSDYKVAVAGSSGWRYVGPDGTSLTYYVPANSEIPININLKFHNNHRYFRYKVVLSPDSTFTLTPVVDDVIINWSP